MAGIWMPSGKISFSFSNGLLKRYTCQSTSVRGWKVSPCFCSTGSHRLLRHPSRGLVTTVLFSIGISRLREKLSVSIFPITPSSCQGCDEHEGKYLVHERFSLMSVSWSRDSVLR